MTTPAKSSRLLSAFCLAASAFPLLAHPGHSHGEASLSHLLTSPYHVTVLALAGVAMLGAAHFIQRRLPRRVLQASGAAALLGAVLVWGLSA